jgi:RimJ/RimL family protein N-acetyltransferase
MADPRAPAPHTPLASATPAPPPAPPIDTERLSLRGHRLDDFADSLALWSDPVVVRHIGGRPFTEEEVWTRLLRYAGHWTLLGYGYWVLRERESGRFVGEAGFADYRREIEPSLDGEPEAGWVIATWAHGKGYATEAVRAVHDWGATHFGRRRTVCMIGAANLASIRVAEKCGYRETEHTTYHGRPVILYHRQGD